MKFEELENGDLQREDGVIIPKQLRTRCEIYSRVVGYLRPVSSWNTGKRKEFEDRKVYKIKEPILNK